MSAVTTALGAGAGAAALSLALTPVAIRVAARTGFLDHPTGYKCHRHATPYLGGSAVVAAFLVAALLLGADGKRSGVLFGGVLVLWLLGTIDDRRPLGAGRRVLVEGTVGLAVAAAGLGWSLTGSGAVDAVLTAVWIVGITNAFNLTDNMDGAAGTVGVVAAGGLGAIAIEHGGTSTALLALALAGACAGTLPFNLARPSRIFLGDGGTLPIGFLLAALAIEVPGRSADAAVSLAAVVLLGLPILDTALVFVSRIRRGVSPLQGGQDHLTFRILALVGSARKVAIALAVLQAALGALAAVGLSAGLELLVPIGLSCALAGALVVVALESRWSLRRTVVIDQAAPTRLAPVAAAD